MLTPLRIPGRLAITLSLVVTQCVDLSAQSRTTWRTQNTPMQDSYSSALNSYSAARGYESTGNDQYALDRYLLSASQFQRVGYQSQRATAHNQLMASQYGEALVQVESARLLATAERYTEMAPHLARAKQTLVELQNTHSDTPSITGQFWDKAIAWRMYYVWGSLDLLECRFADAKWHFQVSNKLKPEFEPALAMKMIIEEQGLDKLSSSGCTTQVPRKTATRQPIPDVQPAPVRTEPRPIKVLECEPEKVSPAPKPRKQVIVAAPKPVPPPTPVYRVSSHCPTILEALRKVVGPARMALYASALIGISADLLKASTFGPWGTALLVGAKLIAVGGHAYDDFEKARALVAACKQ